MLKIKQPQAPGRRVLDLSGGSKEGEALYLVSMAITWGKQLGLDTQKLSNEMLSGDYFNLVAIFHENFQSVCDLEMDDELKEIIENVLKERAGTKLYKSFEDVKIGDIAWSDPAGTGDRSDTNLYNGVILWKGNFEELKKSEYKGHISDWTDNGEEIEEMMEEENFVVIQTEGFDGGPRLFGYDSDPSSAVVYINKK